jgi:hypothetical protein
MPEAVIQPENLASLGAAFAVSDAIQELGADWAVAVEGPEGVEEEYRSFPIPEWEQIAAVVYVKLASEAITMALDAIRAGAERWRREKARGGTVTIIVVDEETGERSHTIHVPAQRES